MEWLIAIAVFVACSSLVAFGRYYERNKQDAKIAAKLSNAIVEIDRIERDRNDTNMRIDSGNLFESDIGAMLSTYPDTGKHKT